jgi:GTP-binding protein
MMMKNKKSDDFFKITRPQFIIGAAEKTQFPKQFKREFAFIGRSNVGKSSLINALTHSKITKTSKTPGRTREINFFSLGDKCNFVDMPGYGFATATKNEMDKWKRLIEEYLTNREQLVRLFLLLDSKRGIMANDFEFMGFLDNIKIEYQIILTKVDSVNRNEYAKIYEEIKNEIVNHKHISDEILFSSISKEYGLDDIRRVIYDMI